MRGIGRHLTYANVIATLALFLALSGGAVWAAGKINGKRLKAHSVSAGKLKRNAVTAAKIKPNAVTMTKIKAGAVTFAKLGAGTNVIAHGGGSASVPTSATPTTIPLSGSTTFTPTTEAAFFLGVEARSDNLGRVGAEPCDVRVVPLLNGSRWGIAEGGLRLRAFTPTPDEPSGTVPIAGLSAPIGLVGAGSPVALTAKVYGGPQCTPASTVSFAFVLTQEK